MEARYDVPSALFTLLLIAAIPLVIPAAIVVGYRHPHGAMLVSGGAAGGAFVVFWVMLGGVGAFYGNVVGADGFGALVRVVLFVCGLLLLLTAWALALNTAARARQVRWVALLIAAGYLSFVAILISIAPPDPCMLGYQPGIAFGCTDAPNPGLQLLVIAGTLAAPAAALAYGSGIYRPRRALPEGLMASPLAPSGDGGGDDEFEVRAEHMP